MTSTETPRPGASFPLPRHLDTPFKRFTPRPGRASLFPSLLAHSPTLYLDLKTFVSFCVCRPTS